jgi:hypothetical protein
MRRALSILLIFLTASFAHAEPTAFCYLSKRHGEAEIKEVAESKIDFKNDRHDGQRAVGTAVLHFLLSRAKIVVSILERIEKGELHWNSEITLEDGNFSKTIHRDEILTSNGDVEYDFSCEAFAKTEKLKPFSGTVKEKMRLDLLGGPGATREYAEARAESGEQAELERVRLVVYDLYRQLLRVPGVMGDLLRRTREDLGRRGGRIEFSGTLSVMAGRFKTLRKGTACSDGRASYVCDIERFNIAVNYEMGDDPEYELGITVEGTIERESESRLIKKYDISSVSVTEPNGERGGSVSSGGRLNGGN